VVLVVVLATGVDDPIPLDWVAVGTPDIVIDIGALRYEAAKGDCHRCDKFSVNVEGFISPLL
jgi:hypothetical protein